MQHLYKATLDVRNTPAYSQNNGDTIRHVISIWLFRGKFGKKIGHKSKN